MISWADRIDLERRGAAGRSSSSRSVARLRAGASSTVKDSHLNAANQMDDVKPRAGKS